MSTLPRASSPQAVGSVRQIALALGHLWQAPELRWLFVCNCVLGMAVSFVVPFMSMFLTREVKLSLHAFGVFMTLSALINIAISTWLSHRSDTRYSRRSVLLGSAACGALAYVGYAWLRNPWLLFAISSLLLGVASLGFSQLFAQAREHLGRSAVPRSEIPLYMNAFRMAFALSWTVGPAVAAYTLERLSFTGLFLVAALLYLALFVVVLCCVRQEAPRSERTRAAPSEKLSGVLGQPGVLVWFLGIALMIAAHHMSINNMSLLVLQELGGKESQVGVIFSLAPIFELPFMLYIGLLATRMPAEKLIRLSMLVACVYYLGLSLVQAPYQIYPLQALSAAIVSVTSGIAITFFQNKLPGRLGTATNLYANASRIGSTSGYLVFGVVAARFGHRGTTVTCALLALLALLLTSLPTARQLPSDA